LSTLPFKTYDNRLIASVKDLIDPNGPATSQSAYIPPHKGASLGGPDRARDGENRSDSSPPCFKVEAPQQHHAAENTRMMSYM